jgi:hypothetical protein
VPATRTSSALIIAYTATYNKQRGTAQELGEHPADVTATEVLGNIRAMSAVIQDVSPGGLISLAQLLAFDRTLLSQTRMAQHAGVIRTEQNWIGGSDYNPCSAGSQPPELAGAPPPPPPPRRRRRRMDSQAINLVDRGRI